MKEIDFYGEIACKIEQSIISKYKTVEVAYSCNKEFPQMIEEIEHSLGIKNVFNRCFIPKLKLDILFAIINRVTNKHKLVLFEVKYAKALTLSNYSQLLGYLQIAKQIDTGVLFLVNQGGTSSTGFSNDFAEIVHANVLPMNWCVSEIQNSSTRHFRTAICQWYQGGRLIWTDASKFKGISSLNEMIEDIM